MPADNLVYGKHFINSAWLYNNNAFIYKEMSTQNIVGTPMVWNIYVHMYYQEVVDYMAPFVIACHIFSNFTKIIFRSENILMCYQGTSKSLDSQTQHFQIAYNKLGQFY